jgi:hypothetical protein
VDRKELVWLRFRRFFTMAFRAFDGEKWGDFEEIGP